MKGTDVFKETIKAYIESHDVDVNRHPDKTLDKCVDYIFTQVKNSGCNGFTDDEIYGMALHYYDEPNEALGKIEHTSMKVVVNHHVELTEAEKEEAKQAALAEVKRKQIESLTKKETMKKPVMETKQQNQLELF